MGFFEKLKAGLQKTQSKLVHEIKRIVSGSPKLTPATLEELEEVLIGADLGMAMALQIAGAVKRAYETQGSSKLDIFAVARREVAQGLVSAQSPLHREPNRLTVVSIVGVNGTGKTTTAAKLAHLLQAGKETVIVAACDTFRAAAIEQIKLWGHRLHVPVISGNYGADAASVAHDAVTAALARRAGYLLVDTAGRLHTKHNLMEELKKLHRVIAKQVPGAPHEVLLVLDATTGMNAMNQAKEFNKTVALSGLVVTKLDGTSKGGMVIAIHKELGLPIKYIGVGEHPDDLQPFEAKAFALALFPES